MALEGVCISLYTFHEIMVKSQASSADNTPLLNTRVAYTRKRGIFCVSIETYIYYNTSVDWDIMRGASCSCRSNSIFGDFGDFRSLGWLAIHGSPGGKERLQQRSNLNLIPGLLELGDLLRDNRLDIVLAHGFHLTGIFLQYCHLRILVLFQIGSTSLCELLGCLLRG